MASSSGIASLGEKVNTSGTSTAVTDVSHTPKSGLKTGISFVIPKNKLSGALVPVHRAVAKAEVEDLKKEEETRQDRRKTKWGTDLTQDPAVKRGRALALQTRVEQIAAQLELGNLDVELNEDARSPSPPPIYDSSGQRVNTREARKREELELERREAIGECLQLNPSYKAPAGYKPILKEAKLYIPVKEYPGYNFIGLILGPRGNMQKRLETETGTKIAIRGRGATKEGKVVPRDGKEAETALEDLHVYISADTFEKVDAAVALIEPLLDPLNENQIAHKRGLLLELAEMNGTAEDFTKSCFLCGEMGHREWHCSKEKLFAYQFKIFCQICGEENHVTFDCPMKLSVGMQGKVFDKEYLHFMEELRDDVNGGIASHRAAEIFNTQAEGTPKTANEESDGTDQDGPQPMLITATGAQPMPSGWMSGEELSATTGNIQLNSEPDPSKSAENINSLPSGLFSFPVFRQRPNLGDFVSGNIFHPGMFSPQVFNPRLRFLRGAPFIRGYPFLPPGLEFGFRTMMGQRQPGPFPFAQPPMNQGFNSSSSIPTVVMSASHTRPAMTDSLKGPGNTKLVSEQGAPSLTPPSAPVPLVVPQTRPQGTTDRPQALHVHEIRPQNNSSFASASANSTYGPIENLTPLNASNHMSGPQKPLMDFPMQSSSPTSWQTQAGQSQGIENNAFSQPSHQLQKGLHAPPLPLGQPPRLLQSSSQPPQPWQPLSDQPYSGPSMRMTPGTGSPWLIAPNASPPNPPMFSPSVPLQSAVPPQNSNPGVYSFQGRPLVVSPSPPSPIPHPPQLHPSSLSVPPPQPVRTPVPALVPPLTPAPAPAPAPAPTPAVAPPVPPAPAPAPSPVPVPVPVPSPSPGTFGMSFFPNLPPHLSPQGPPRLPVGPPLPEAPRPLQEAPHPLPPPPQPPATPFPGSQLPPRNIIPSSSQPWEVIPQPSVRPPVVVNQMPPPPMQPISGTLLAGTTLSTPNTPKDRLDHFPSPQMPFFQSNRPHTQVVAGEQSWQVPPQLHGHQNRPNVPSPQVSELSHRFHTPGAGPDSPWEHTVLSDRQRVNQLSNPAQSDKSDSQSYDPFAPTSISVPLSSQQSRTKVPSPLGGSNQNVSSMNDFPPPRHPLGYANPVQIDSKLSWSQGMGSPASVHSSVHSTTYSIPFTSSNVQPNSGKQGIPSALKESDDEYDKLMASVGVT